MTEPSNSIKEATPWLLILAGIVATIYPPILPIFLLVSFCALLVHFFHPKRD